jgi:RNA polymerase sigma-70 factor (ECF subfamily)
MYISSPSPDGQGEVPHEGDHEGALLRRAKDGDRDAFEQLYRRHVDAVARQVRFRLGGPDEDVVAEVFLRAWRGLAAFRDLGRPFGAWLHGITRHVVVDEIRRRSRSTPVERVPDRPVDPMTVEMLSLREGMERLPAPLRLVIELKYLADLTNEQVATALGISVGAVNTKQWRALRELARCMEEGP